MSIFSSYKKIFLLGFIIVILVAIPFSVYVAQQRQRTKTQATKSTTLSFEPVSTTVKAGEALTLNIMLDPGIGISANQVSFVKLSISFDASKFTTLSDSLSANPESSNTLTTIVEDPKYDNTAGKASISLSIGADPTKVVTTKTKIAILKLKATAQTTPINPNVTFDVTNTQVLSIASSDQTSENVLLSTTIPATVTVTSATTDTTPTPSSSATLTTIPTCSNLNIDRSASGTSPYSLTFTAIGNDSDGTINKVSFNFGDGPVQVLTTGGGIGTNSVNTQISHTYNNAGTYTAYAILTDNNNNLSVQQANCSKTIIVNAVSGNGGGGTLGFLGNNGTGGTGIGSQGGQLLITQTPQVTPTLTPKGDINLPPTGPSNKILGLGVLGIIFTIIGGALLLL